MDLHFPESIDVDDKNNYFWNVSVFGNESVINCDQMMMIILQNIKDMIGGCSDDESEYPYPVVFAV